MKKFSFLILLAFMACKQENNPAPTENQETPEVVEKTDANFVNFGEEIGDANVLTRAEMKAQYEQLAEGDTLNVAFKSEVEKVCKKKGCWMSLDLGEDEATFVRFKDYAFFVPLNSEERETVVKGKAFISKTSVEELKHYAKDAGKSQEEIDAITGPKVEYAFMADGVLMQE